MQNSQSVSQDRRSNILKAFYATYPDPKSELDFCNEFELIIAVMLSAQTTDKKVNEVTPILFKKYPGFKYLMKARLADVEKIVRPLNYYRTKAKHIIETSKQVVENFNGVVPATHEELVTLPGVGRKTANVVLTETGHAPAIAVDTHVYRVARRLGLSEGKKPHNVEEDLMQLFPKNLWRNLHHYLILHGRRICKAQRPLCDVCPLVELCPSARLFLNPT